MQLSNLCDSVLCILLSPRCSYCTRAQQGRVHSKGVILQVSITLVKSNFALKKTRNNLNLGILGACWKGVALPKVLLVKTQFLPESFRRDEGYSCSKPSAPGKIHAHRFRVDASIYILSANIVSGQEKQLNFAHCH